MPTITARPTAHLPQQFRSSPRPRVACGGQLRPWKVARRSGRRRGMKIELANRIRELPPYLFAQIDALKQEQRKKGADLIDLGIGDPDLPTHPHIIDALATAA